MDIEKLKRLEEKFWDAFENEDSMANDLLDSAIVIMRGYRSLYHQTSTKNIGTANVAITCSLNGIEDVEEALQELQDRISNLKVSCTI